MCVSKYHTKIQILRRIVTFLTLLMAEITEKYNVVYEKAMAKVLYKKPRTMYARLVGDLPVLGVIVELYLSTVEFLFRDPEDDEDLRSQMLKALESLIAAVGDHQWHRCSKEMLLLLSMLTEKMTFKREE